MENTIAKKSVCMQRVCTAKPRVVFSVLSARMFCDDAMSSNARHDAETDTERQDVPWMISLAVGGLGGAINAALTRQLHLAPVLITAAPSQRVDAVQLGVLGNVVIAAAASAMGALTMAGGCPEAAPSETQAMLAAGGGLSIGFVVARWCTSEADKLLLRRAVCSASIAPAAHPDTVAALEHAHPLAVYHAAKAMMPRRTGHR
jgi:hypothetical protein